MAGMLGATRSAFARFVAWPRVPLGRNFRFADTITRRPAPARPQATAMPATDRLRPGEGKCADGRAEPAAEPDKQQAKLVDIGRFLVSWL